MLLGSISFLLALVLAVAYWLGGPSLIHFLWAEALIGISVASFGYRELMGYSDTNARYARSRAQFVRTREALSLARPDPHDSGMLRMRQWLRVEAMRLEKIDELNDWVGDQLHRVYTPGG